MNLERKLEEIRQKPEHIRLRYVWAAVVICMLFVILIWIFSFGQNVKSTKENEAILPDFKSELESQKQNLPSIDTLTNSGLESSADTSGEGVTDNINSTKALTNPQP